MLKSWKIRILILLTLSSLWAVYDSSILQLLPISSIYLGPPKGSVSPLECGGSYTTVLAAEKVAHAPFPFEDISTLVYPEVFVVTLEKGRVLGRNGVVITADDRVLTEVANEWCPIEKHSIFKKLKLPPMIKSKERIAVIASTGGDCNYFHWMTDVLPRLEILRRASIPYDKLYINAPRKKFQEMTLAKLGIDECKVIWGKKKTHIQAQTLIVPSLPGESGRVPKWVCAFLREKFLPKSVPAPTRRLYISRANAQRRRVKNEEEVYTFLKKWGFEKVHLENLSHEAQVELSASAEVIVAPHGAGLTNLVFSAPDTKVIEICSPYYHSPCFWLISDHLSLNHNCLMANVQPNTNDALEVPLDELAILLNKLNLSEL